MKLVTIHCQIDGLMKIMFGGILTNKMLFISYIQYAFAICPLKRFIISNTGCISESFKHILIIFQGINDTFFDKLYRFDSFTVALSCMGMRVKFRVMVKVVVMPLLLIIC